MKIPLFEIYWDDDDIEAIKNIISSGMNWACGKEIEEFEKSIAEYLNVKYCVIFNSGGTALYSLMKAYGFEPGDEIIIPSFTFIATAYAPIYVGAKPVFADVEKETFGLDPVDVKKRITPKTKALIPIHYGGMPCKIDEIKEIAEENDLILIEDAAESFGAKLDGNSVGSFGHSSIFSFCQNKVFTTGEGGCVVTNDKEFYNKLKMIRSYGRVVNGDYFNNPGELDYIQIGHNYRMSTILAALGLSQLNKVDKTTNLRRESAEYLNKNLKEIEDIVVPTPPDNRYHAIYQMYTIRVLEGEDTRNNLMEFLKDRGITTRIYFPPVHEYSIIKEKTNNDVNVPVTEELSKEVLTLPLYPGINREKLDYIIENIKKFFKEG